MSKSDKRKFTCEVCGASAHWEVERQEERIDTGSDSTSCEKCAAERKPQPVDALHHGLSQNTLQNALHNFRREAEARGWDVEF